MSVNRKSWQGAAYLGLQNGLSADGWEWVQSHLQAIASSPGDLEVLALTVMKAASQRRRKLGEDVLSLPLPVSASTYCQDSGSRELQISVCDLAYGLWLDVALQRELPGMAEKLDIDGDGRGDMWVGGEGWMMTAAYEVKIRDYGLDGFDALIAAEGEFQKTLYDAFAARDHLVFACYQPMTWFAMEHIEFIQEPDYDPAQHRLVLPGEDADWKAKSRVTVGEQVSRVSVARRTDLAQRFPKAAALLDDFALTQDDLVEFMFMAEIKGVALDAVVRDWIAANEARIAAWSGGGA